MAGFLSGLVEHTDAPVTSSASRGLGVGVDPTATAGVQTGLGGPAETIDPLTQLAQMRATLTAPNGQVNAPNLAGAGLRNLYQPGPGYNPAAASAPTGAAPSIANVTGPLADFMAAERQQESGGNYTVMNSIGAGGAYQFMPATWRSDAAAAGYGQYANTPVGRVPANIQDAVAQHAMQNYYNQFGNWGDVAKAWYAGGGFAQDNQTAPQYGGPSIDQYAADVMAIMQRLLGK